MTPVLGAAVAPAALLMALAVLLPSAAAATSPPAPPPPPVSGPGWMFDPSVMVDVHLTIPPSSMEQISGDLYAPRPYVPVTFSMSYADPAGFSRSYGPWNVSLKVKGMFGSFRNLPAGEKAGLKIKFPSGRRPDGLKKFTLNNMVQDGSMVREALAYHVFREMGVAAPRVGYARVTINGVYYGIYLNVETMDDVALPRWFGSTGHLYEGSYGNWFGEVADPFSGHYEVDEGDEEDRADLQELINAARSRPKGWLERMERVADLEQMTVMWACEWFTGHWDGYSQHLPNNYYLHADASGRFTMLPWGADQTFTWAARFNDAPDHFIFNNCLRDPIGRAMYTDALHAVAARWEGFGLAGRAEAAHALVAGESQGIDDVRWFIWARLEEHRAWAATLPAAPTGVRVVQSGSPRQLRQELTWDRPRAARGEPAVLGHAVEYRAEGGAWRRLELNRAAKSVKLDNLPPGSYTVRVRAIGRQGDSLPVTSTITVR